MQAAMPDNLVDRTTGTRPIKGVPFDQWLALWRGYLGDAFSAMDPAIHQSVFARLQDDADPLKGIVAGAGEPVGFAHFYLHPSTYSLADACMLEDLYVSPASRRQGVARFLIAEVARCAKELGAHVLHWKTEESNAGAAALYDEVAQRTGFITYRLPL